MLIIVVSDGDDDRRGHRRRHTHRLHHRSPSLVNLVWVLFSPQQFRAPQLAWHPLHGVGAQELYPCRGQAAETIVGLLGGVVRPPKRPTRHDD